jgi:molecular chaperone DnaK
MMGEAIGIDLGTTNSGAGYFENGKARILLTSESQPLTPSVISYDPRKDCISTGRQAWRQLERYPDTTVFSIKRLMGRTFDDEDIDKVMKVQERFGYRIVEADDPQDRSLRVQLGQEKFSAVDISAMILGRVKEDASRVLGNRPVTHAVITVPAYFSERQKAATRLAAEKAGLIVKKIIDEPTAAAVAFGIDHTDERHRLLVYDMGGGTFDISLIQTTQQRFQVLGIEGDNWLGGDDFDLEIVQSMLDWIQASEGVDLSQDKTFLAAAKKKAEEAKITLSGQDRVEIYGELRTQTGQAMTVDLEISRSQFESWIRPYVDRSMELAHKVLASQSLTPEDITAVLMVGGATNVPLVHETAYEIFGQDKVRRDVDPMQCVALGAGILAARLKTIECPQCGYENPESITECEKCQHNLEHAAVSGDISLGEVTPQSLGIEVVRGRTAGMFSVIIEKGTPYPVRTERVYYTTSDRHLRLPIYQGENELAARNELQATVEFALPESIPPETPVMVTFGLDRDQVLTVSVRVHGYPHLTFEEIIKRGGPPPRAEPREPEAQADDRWQRALQSTIAVANNFIKQYGSYLATGIQKKLTSDIEHGRQALREENAAEGKRIAEAITKTILGSGAATQLFLVERIIDDVGESEAKLLKRGVHELQAAHKGGDTEREEQLANALAVRVGQFFEEKQRHRQYDERATGFEGLLLEELWGGR